ncbi:constitutive coactivator of PPAR-gamma-like protein 2 isoform X2 [Dermochelys coriacea]|uniref:constitutive coactivator of PPAR-gamma-like protein 2 isoform X2 n=1 Tax=Dermochelys coriacea TaxID=27794 RepID=UPI0018E80629|nr:constitutive coactivator of PPAR-gamma-like protein 2 isoform X2 [Dermochelys coriacea]
MGVQGFQEFVEKRCPGAVVPVDLLKLARAAGVRGGPSYCSLAGYLQPQPGPYPPPLATHSQHAPGLAANSQHAPGLAANSQHAPELASVAHSQHAPGLATVAAHSQHAPGLAAHSQHAPGLATVVAHSQHAPGLTSAYPARLLVDADSALQRLYGGYQTDWVCGGQWNAMVGYLAALSQACLYQGGLELAVIFNGGLGKERLPEWGRKAQAERQTAQLIAGHVGNKGTPPPRAWFLPPACLGHCVRLAMIRFRVKVFQSLEDHHLEVVSFFRERGFHGLLAHDSEFALASLPCYFSAHALKLSWNGKSLTTNQFLMHQVAKQLGLKVSSFPIFAALLGNHILPDEDLAAFHWSLLGPDHPLASLKVRAHQLVLPPCDVVIKAVSEYVSAIKDPYNLDAVGRDVFKHSQSRTEDKIERFKKAVNYYSVTAKMPLAPVDPSSFVLPGYGSNHFGGAAPAQRSPVGSLPMGKPMFPHHLGPKMQFQPPAPPSSSSSAASFPPGPSASLLFSSHPLADMPPFNEDPILKGGEFNSWPSAYDAKFPHHYRGPKPSPSSGPASSPSSSSDGEEHNGGSANHVSEVLQPKSGWEGPGAEKLSRGWGQAGGSGDTDGPLAGPEPSIPSLLSMATRNHMDITTPPLPPVAPEVLRVAEHRHRRGLMYPSIYHVLTKGEIKLPVCIEDECNTELPPAAILFRGARQHIYGVLFGVAENQRRVQRLAIRRRIPTEVPPVIIKEWAAYKGKSPQTPELVSALAFREWTCPNLRKLWLGKAVEDKNRRMRAFLACLRADTPGMLNPANVPTHLLLMCCVLRYMIQWPGGRILHRHELDVFLAQAVSSQLYEPDHLQELKIEKLDARGVQLAALFMSGVDTALFANDACGQPVPWEHCCPWIYFDGKLFQSKLIKATRDRAPLIDLCDGQTEQAAKVERMRQSILEGVNINRQAPPPLLPPPPFVPAMAAPFYSMPLYPRTTGSMPLPPPGRSRGLTGLHPIPPQGGKLEIAGMVVGQWAGSKPSRGRGSFGMQVVSVGGPGKGRSRDGSGKLPKGNKKLSKQGSLEGAAKAVELQSGQGPSQVNGGEDSGGSPCPPAPSQCALARDADPCGDKGQYCGRLTQEVDRGPNTKLSLPALQKEE